MLKIQLNYLDVRDSKDIETAFGAASKGRADAIVVLGSPVLNLRRTQIADLAVKNRMPGVYAQPEFIDAGGLMYYGASFTDIFQRAATYVDKILKGAKPRISPLSSRSVRVRRQPESRQTNRPDDTTECVGQS